ncbi:hypothetical protein OEW28_13305 [Defluviimonas sp. WL0002]|uniref:PhyR sigma2 domain-containing protein n=1 Tax=Albidovulum marisflavi TaxID=2984159 RepID=A0ABT2ZES0_9RHOB|nr:hypothetical protein [Defluviimonas sp. WL0002]MCV2869606.1 hypothetical protein [Defluviimonas sp. WL0002]
MKSPAKMDILLPELRAYARSLHSQPDISEDLVQDAVERTLKLSNIARALCELRPWMFRVSTLTCLQPT